MAKLSKVWREFAEAWLAFLENMSEENKQRLYAAMEKYLVGETESKQEDWIYETKDIIGKIQLNDRTAWRKIYIFIKERYGEYDYAQKILAIAQSKNIGESVW